MDPSRSSSLIAKLEKGLRKTFESLNALTREQWQQPIYADPPWQVHHLLAHLVSAETQLLALAQNVAAGGPGARPNLDIDTFNAAEQARLEGLATPALLDQLNGFRQQTIAWVQTLHPDQLDRLGRHPALGEVTVETMIAAMYGHHLLHMRDLNRLQKERGPQ